MELGNRRDRGMRRDLRDLRHQSRKEGWTMTVWWVPQCLNGALGQSVENVLRNAGRTYSYSDFSTYVGE